MTNEKKVILTSKLRRSLKLRLALNRALARANEIGQKWAYPTVQDWERRAGYKTSPEFRSGFRCARNENKHRAWQRGYDMGRMTNALLRALSAGANRG